MGQPSGTLRWDGAERIADAQRVTLTGRGAPFELVEEDVIGVRLPVFSQRPPDLRVLLSQAARRFGDRPYLSFPERSFTFASMLAAANGLARVLSKRFDVGKGDRVAIASANTWQYPVVFWAATSLGAVTVGLNGWWTGEEMASGLELTRPSVLFGDRRRLERLAATTPPLVCFEDDFAGLGARDDDDAPDVALAEDDPFVVLFTSGTTGRAKGAVLSHRGAIHFLLASALTGAAAAGVGSGGDPACVVSASPMFHVSGLHAQVIAGTLSGTEYVYPPPGRFEEARFLEMCQRHRATSWSLTPTQLWRLLDWPGLEQYDLASVRRVGGGSAVWSPELLRAVAQRLPHLRPALSTGYGMTETNGLGTSLRPAATFEHPDSIGQAAPGVEVEIRDPTAGAVVEEGTGEICMRSAANLLGYFDDADATSAALDGKRRYHTGDFGHVADGFLYLDGRRQDLIIRGGENIYPIEIENRIVEHPAVAEVAVIGVEHRTLGQEVKAVIVPRVPGSISAEELQRYCAGSLAAFKIPAHVVFVDALPKNAMGKVLKHLIDRPLAGDGTLDS